jgi:hypothetical protein
MDVLGRKGVCETPALVPFVRNLAGVVLAVRVLESALPVAVVAAAGPLLAWLPSVATCAVLLVLCGVLLFAEGELWSLCALVDALPVHALLFGGLPAGRRREEPQASLATHFVPSRAAASAPPVGAGESEPLPRSWKVWEPALGVVPLEVAEAWAQGRWKEGKKSVAAGGRPAPPPRGHVWNARTGAFQRHGGGGEG